MSKWLEKQLERERLEAEQETNVAVAEDLGESAAILEPNGHKPGSTYIWMQYDNIWDVSRRLKLDPHELMEHNEIEDWKSIVPGDELHLPFAKPNPHDKITYFELLDEPLQMHVTKVGGCRKWAFGDMKTWDDAKSSGFFPENSNLVIVAIAHVPIIDKDNPDAEAAYYMDASALGDFRESGRIRWALGYIWNDLAPGHVERTVTPAPAAEIAIEQQKEKEILARSFHAYKETYQVLAQPIECMAMIPETTGQLDPQTGVRYIVIQDYDDVRPPRRLYQHQEVMIGGTFEHEGVLLGRHVNSMKAFNWYGIPMEMLESTADVYNAEEDARTRAARGNTLTFVERMITVPFSKIVTDPRYKKYFDKYKKKG